MRQTTLTTVIVLLLSSFASAQRSQIEIATEVITSMDRNRDGRLEAGEIPIRSRAAVVKLAREAGLNLAKPLSIDKLKKQLAKRKRQDEGSGRGKQPAENPNASNGNGGSSTAGFGTTSQSSPVPGFSRPDEGKNAPSRGTANQGDRQVEKNRSDEERSAGNDRVRRYAESLMKRHDANKNGVLDRDEWTKLKGKPAESDTNKDGRLSIDELTVLLRDYGTNGKTAVKGESPKPKKVAKRRARKDASRKSYRFLSPTERLAESLPRSLRDWFLRKDKNGDGQIAMSEFASIWSREQAVDFSSYDQNNDGVITPQEYLRVKTGATKKN